MSQGASLRPRETWIDVTRALLQFMVVFDHTTHWVYVGDETLPSVVQGLIHGGQVFRMPLLFFLSGLFLSRAAAKGFPHVISSRLRTIFWPVLVWLALFSTLSGIREGSLDVALDTAMHPLGTYLWFLVYLGLFFIGGSFLKRVPAAVSVSALLIVAVAAPGTMSKFAFLFAVFLFGDAFARHRDSLQAFLVRPVVTAISVVVLTGGVLSNALPGHSHSLEHSPLAFLWLVAAVAVVLTAAKSAPSRWVSSPPVRFLGYVGRNTMVLYVSHIVVMRTLALLWPAWGASSPPFIMATGFVVSVSVGLGLIWARHRWRFAALLFEWPASAAGKVSSSKTSIRQSSGSPRKNAAVAIDNDLGRRQ